MESSMTQPSDLTHITPSDGNVFADLGFDADEAIALQDWSQATIRKKLRGLTAPCPHPETQRHEPSDL